ncbi:hypothetical protein [uncultured Psychrosphaera sp.]|uniref:hypothetical protein n=1 Tax=uncultured Psychrosphaera sp. TaxID=1403522 RepID=UPI002620BAE6|nr:hypothetical protein [uncultured Psychrosphaera sp.]
MLRKGWLFTSWMMGCHQNRDVLSDDQGTIFQPFFVNKNNYLMKYWILFGSGALFHYKSRLRFWAVEKRYGRRQGETYSNLKYNFKAKTTNLTLKTNIKKGEH